MTKVINVNTHGQGLYEITDQVQEVVHHTTIEQGLCCVFVMHTSASLIIQENADPSAKRDLEAWLNRLVKERDTLYTHTQEGDDDMPAHIKAAITATSLTIPIAQGILTLGTWQGIYLWEHRKAAQRRNIAIAVVG